jgi:hypothetical protein
MFICEIQHAKTGEEILNPGDVNPSVACTFLEIEILIWARNSSFKCVKDKTDIDL